MKFFGNGVVWDREKNKVLCKFENGEFETDCSKLAEKIMALGYKHEGEYITIIESNPESPELELEIEIPVEEVEEIEPIKDHGIAGTEVSKPSKSNKYK